MSDGPRSLWGELKQRKVVRVAGVYAAVGWAVIVGGNELTQILQLPLWVPQLVLVLVVLGFPVAMVLAWAFEITPEGIRRTPSAADAPTERTSGMPFIAGVVVGVASLSAVAFLVRDSPSSDGAALDETLVAIIPFSYSGPPELEYLGDGVAHLLASRFTGDVGPRATDAAATATLWDVAATVSPIDAARNVAVQLGAGLILTGSVVAGPDGMSLSAELVGARDGSERASATVRGPADSLTTVVERLGGGILSLSIGEYPESLAQLTSTSPEALREYLLGQLEFRQGRVHPAHLHFSRAADIDSTFALASLWEADAANNVANARTGALARAWRHRDRLGERDRVYLAARVGPNYPDPSTRDELQLAYRDALRMQPDRANLLYWLGENAVHFPKSRASYDEAYGYFSRAVALDPRNASVLLHLQLAAMLRGDREAVLDATQRRAAVDTTRGMQIGLRALRALFSGDTATVMVLWDSVPGTVGVFTVDAPSSWVGSWQTEIELRQLDRRSRELVPGRGFTEGYSASYFNYQDLGQPTKAGAILDLYERGADEPAWTTRILDATYGALPDHAGPEAADGVLSSLADVSGDAWTQPLLNRRVALELWRLTRGDTSGVASAVRLLREHRASFPSAAGKSLEAQALLLEASVQARRADPAARSTIEAMDRLFLERPPGLGVQMYDAMVLATADVYERIGDPAAALLVLERESNFDNVTWPFNARFARERGRLAALTGDSARAIRDYEFYLRLRAFAEPSLASEVAEVRGTLDGLRR
jgi:tetratricopeptide (TPR) repeat protein/TolB-like protein